MNVAFHILTLGIPWAIYMLTASFQTADPNTANHESRKVPIVYSQELAPFKEITHRDVIDTACQKAEKLSPRVLRHGLTPPKNPHILRLWTLFSIEEKTLNQRLKQYSNQTPWAELEVLAAAHALMETAYSISVLTLEDLYEINLPPFSYLGTLISQRSSAYLTFFHCTAAYHKIRGGWEYSIEDGEEYVQPPCDPNGNLIISPDHAACFYEEETNHSHWRSLYNEFCQRVRMYVSEYDLQHAEDLRYARWVVPDTDMAAIFKPCPDTLPT